MAIDWDDVLAYSTTKIVRIRSAKLGGVYRLAQVGIFLYVVVYTIILNKGYNKVDEAIGDVSCNVRRAEVQKKQADLPYCTPATKCVSWPPAMTSVSKLHSLLVATRISAANLTLNSACGLYDYDCDLYTVTGNETVYVGDVEDSTIQVEHTVTAGGLVGGSEFPSSNVVMGWNSKSCDKCKSSWTQSQGQGDVMTLQQLLDAAGVDLSASDTRYEGITLLVKIAYNNTADRGKIDYAYHVLATDIQAKEAMHYPLGDVILDLNLHGVKLVFLQEGGVGVFDFFTLLLNCVAGMALLASAATLADLALVYVLPQKHLYMLFKYSQTPDFDPDDEHELALLDKVIRKKQKKNHKLTGVQEDLMTE